MVAISRSPLPLRLSCGPPRAIRPRRSRATGLAGDEVEHWVVELALSFSNPSVNDARFGLGTKRAMPPRNGKVADSTSEWARLSARAKAASASRGTSRLWPSWISRSLTLAGSMPRSSALQLLAAAPVTDADRAQDSAAAHGLQELMGVVGWLGHGIGWLLVWFVVSGENDDARRIGSITTGVGRCCRSLPEQQREQHEHGCGNRQRPNKLLDEEQREGDERQKRETDDDCVWLHGISGSGGPR